MRRRRPGHGRHPRASELTDSLATGTPPGFSWPEGMRGDHPWWWSPRILCPRCAPGGVPTQHGLPPRLPGPEPQGPVDPVHDHASRPTTGTRRRSRSHPARLSHPTGIRTPSLSVPGATMSVSEVATGGKGTRVTKFSRSHPLRLSNICATIGHRRGEEGTDGHRSAPGADSPEPDSPAGGSGPPLGTTPPLARRPGGSSSAPLRHTVGRSVHGVGATRGVAHLLQRPDPTSTSTHEGRGVPPQHS